MSSRSWLAVLTPAALLSASCSKPRSLNEGEVPPTVTLRGVTLTRYQGEARVAVGRAEQVAYLRGDLTLVAFDAGVRLEGGGANPRAAGVRVSAHALVGNLATREVDGSGAVRMTSPSGLTATTEEARFHAATLEVDGSRPIHVVSPGQTIDAESFHARLAEESFEFDGGVTVEMEQP